jgi:predicted outer membrane repeat protein
MRTSYLAKLALGVGGALALLTVAPAAIASASPAVSVPCSGGAAGLIAAINSANIAGGTVNLSPGCDYSLTAPNNTNPNPLIGANGLPVVTNQVTINGFNTTISRNPSSATPFRIFEVDGPGGSLTLAGLTITGGSSSSIGGGIVNNGGVVTVSHSRVTGNAAVGGGGGIASGDLGKSTALLGTLTLNNSQVSSNTVTGGSPNFPNAGGGIIDKSGTVGLNDSQVTWNTAAGSAGGIANVGGALTLNFSQVSNNTSQGGGGGIASGNGNGGTIPPPSSTLTLFRSQVNGNTSNGGPTGGAGGLANGGIATITLSQVNGNSAPGAPGGGILNHGTMTINLSQVNYNNAPNDSSIPPDPGAGGGIANVDFGVPNSGILTLNGTQVDNNTASGQGGGIAEEGFDTNGNLVAGNTLSLNFSLVTGNTATGGGGGIYASSGSPVTLKWTLVVRNHPDNCEPIGAIGGCLH